MLSCPFANKALQEPLYAVTAILQYNELASVAKLDTVQLYTDVEAFTSPNKVKLELVKSFVVEVCK